MSSIANNTATEDLAFSYDVSGSFDDVDLIHGDTLTYSLEGSPPGWLSINASTGEITGTPTNGDVGVTTITVRVTDGSGETAQTNFDLTVDNVNDVPTVSSIANNTATEDLAFSYDVSGSFDDVDLIHGDTLTYSLEGSPPGWLSINASTGEITGTPTNGDVGVTTITVRVTDGSGETAQTNFDLTVDNVNDVPTVSSIANNTATEDLAFSYDVSGSFDDVDLIHGDTLTYSLEGSPPGWLSINASTGEITGTPTNGDVGVTTITVRVTDGSGETAQTNFDLTVDNVNDVPTVSSIANNTATEDLAFSYDVSGSFDDVDLIHGDTLTYSLEGSPPGWLSINASTGEISGTPTNGDVGVTTITVRVTDGSGETAQTNFDLTVDNVNDVPTVSSIANNTATEDLAFSYDVSGSFDDVDLIHGDSLTYSLEGSPPGWLSINASTGEITGTPTNGDVGVTTITVRVTDGSGETAQTNFDLTVDNVNDVPTVSSIANNTATEDLAFSYDVSGSFDDVDLIHGDTLTYSLEGSPPGWLSINASTGEITGTPTNGDVGVTTITVRVTDGSGETAQTNFDLTVDNVNDVPTVSSIANNTATEDLAFSYDVSGSFDDVDLIHGDTLTYSLEGSPPGWLSINASTGEITGTPTNGDVGVTTITVRVTDGSGETAQTSFDLTVNFANDAPIVVTPIANNLAVENSAFSYNVSSSFDDEDIIHGDSLSYSLEPGAPAWMLINATTGQITGTPSGSDIGAFPVTVRATDAAGAWVTDTFYITVKGTDDKVSGSGSSDLTSGIASSEEFLGDAAAEEISGDVFAKLINSAQGGDDTIVAGGGDDIVYGDADSNIENTAVGGDDVIYGDAGIDTIYGDAKGQLKDSAQGGVDTIYGGDGGDTIIGDAGGDMHVNSVAGADIIYGDGGIDTIYGDTDEHMYDSSQGGNDYIEGGAGADIIVGDAGDDIDHTAIAGDDTIYGGDDNDTIYGDTLKQLKSSAQGGDDIIYGEGGADIIVGDAGDDIDHTAIAGDDTIYGGDDNDTIYGDTLKQLKSSAQGGDDIIYGEGGDDTIVGDAGDKLESSAVAGNDSLYGGTGNDTIYGDAINGDTGLGGDDYIEGGAGADTMYGGSGDDIINFDNLDAIVDGGVGFDTAEYNDTGTYSFSNLDNIEKVDISDGQASSKTISVSSVIGATDSDNDLYLEGDLVDTVTLDGEAWTDTGTTHVSPEDGITYDVYTGYSGTTLWVDQDINVNYIPD